MDMNSADHDVAQGAYQHDYIQASLLREWKMKSKHPVDDGDYNIFLDDAASSISSSSSSSLTTTATNASNMAINGQSRVAAAWRETLTRYRENIALISLLVFSTIAMCMLSAHISSSPSTLEEPPSRTTMPSILDIPPTIRRADEEALDRIAMMLPSRWQDWLVSPPYLSAAWTSHPSVSMRQLHQELIRLMGSSSVRSISNQSLLEQLRHANGFDDLDSVYVPDLQHGWLRDAAQCWRFVPPILNRLYCPLRHPDIATHARELILDPWQAYVAEELDFLKAAAFLLSQLEAASIKQQADTLLSVHDMFAETARKSFPLDGIEPYHNPSQRDQLTQHYTHYAQSAFFELLASTLQPELKTRITHLSAFQDSLESQKLHLQQATSTSIRTFHQATLAWIPTAAAYALRTRTFGNATAMRRKACEWTLLRMPLLDDDDDNPSAEEEQVEEEVDNDPKIHHNNAPHALHQTTQRDRITLYNNLLTHLWLSTSSPPSVRWHWDEGGSFTFAKEASVKDEWRAYVQGKFDAVWRDSKVVGVQRRGGMEEEDESGGMEEDLTRLPPRWDGQGLQWSWPKLRGRRECRERHLEALEEGRRRRRRGGDGSSGGDVDGGDGDE